MREKVVKVHTLYKLIPRPVKDLESAWKRHSYAPLANLPNLSKANIQVDKSSQFLPCNGREASIKLRRKPWQKLDTVANQAVHIGALRSLLLHPGLS